MQGIPYKYLYITDDDGEECPLPRKLKAFAVQERGIYGYDRIYLVDISSEDEDVIYGSMLVVVSHKILKKWQERNQLDRNEVLKAVNNYGGKICSIK